MWLNIYCTNIPQYVIVTGALVVNKLIADLRYMYTQYILVDIYIRHVF